MRQPGFWSRVGFTNVPFSHANLASTLWIWINDVIEIRTDRHGQLMGRATSFQRLIGLELEQ